MTSKVDDLYALLGVPADASAEQLRKAFRKESLRCHPDKNPDDKDAVDRFYALKEAFDLLSAPEKRAAYDAKRETALKQAERFASLNGKRQADIADLQAREEAFKRQKTAQRDERNELERIKEQNARMMRERMAQQTATPLAAPAASPAQKPAAASRLGEHDTKVSLKWPATATNPVLLDSTALEAALAKLCGEVSTCAVLPKRKAIVEFTRLSSAVKAVDWSGKAGTVLESVAVTWLMGEPETVKAARARGAVPQAASPVGQQHAPAAAPPAVDEGSVLAKLKEQQRRKAEERARLEAEILAQDAEDQRVASAGR